MSISRPNSLTHADTILHLADEFSRLLDPKERAKIVDDIKAHHALNETEYKLYIDAKSLIKEHKKVLDDTQALSSKNAVESAVLGKNKEEFNQLMVSQKAEIQQEWDKIYQKRAELDAYSKQLCLEKEDLSRWENQLDKDRKAHVEDISKLEADRKYFFSKKSEREDILESLDKEIAEKREKLEMLRQLNI